MHEMTSTPLADHPPFTMPTLTHELASTPPANHPHQLTMLMLTQRLASKSLPPHLHHINPYASALHLMISAAYHAYAPTLPSQLLSYHPYAHTMIGFHMEDCSFFPIDHLSTPATPPLNLHCIPSLCICTPLMISASYHAYALALPSHMFNLPSLCSSNDCLPH
ncbi:hypothetical protein O181_035363 [Austropuccinia psidii MF-1]|uniref:Uncharacterized protein n=1 Tax=Austropuccinia psidii MF-1 TaxID=1389203 RepID=A0A9Q3D5B5_9BASI|nr:hypothetical protein [Austropuccinia psidii MF-1]